MRGVPTEISEEEPLFLLFWAEEEQGSSLFFRKSPSSRPKVGEGLDLRPQIEASFRLDVPSPKRQPSCRACCVWLRVPPTTQRRSRPGRSGKAEVKVISCRGCFGTSLVLSLARSESSLVQMKQSFIFRASTTKPGVFEV